MKQKKLIITKQKKLIIKKNKDYFHGICSVKISKNNN